MVPKSGHVTITKIENLHIAHEEKFIDSKNAILLDLQGAPIKNNPLEKILYLRNCSRFFHQIYAINRGGFRPINVTPNLGFKVTGYLQVEYLKNGAFQGQSY